MALRLALLATLATAACAPTLQLREGDQADRLRAIAQRFCDATASGDIDRIASVFRADLASAIISASASGHPPAFVSRANPRDCTPGKISYIGGSRRRMEVLRDGYTDTLDLWLSDAGHASDLIYGDTGQSLRKSLGLD